MGVVLSLSSNISRISAQLPSVSNQSRRACFLEMYVDRMNMMFVMIVWADSICWNTNFVASGELRLRMWCRYWILFTESRSRTKLSCVLPSSRVQWLLELHTMRIWWIIDSDRQSNAKVHEPSPSQDTIPWESNASVCNASNVEMRSSNNSCTDNHVPSNSEPLVSPSIPQPRRSSASWMSNHRRADDQCIKWTTLIPRTRRVMGIRKIRWQDQACKLVHVTDCDGGLMVRYRN